jgi:hypothetical protein
MQDKEDTSPRLAVSEPEAATYNEQQQGNGFASPDPYCYSCFGDFGPSGRCEDPECPSSHKANP